MTYSLEYFMSDCEMFYFLCLDLRIFYLCIVYFDEPEVTNRSKMESPIHSPFSIRFLCKKKATSMSHMKLKNGTWFICLHIFLLLCISFTTSSKISKYLWSIWKWRRHCYKPNSHPFAMFSHFICANFIYEKLVNFSTAKQIEMYCIDVKYCHCQC